MGPEALRGLRAAYQCDCDPSSKGAPYPTALKVVFDQFAGSAEQITGHRPPTCPWRSMYDPLVQEVVRLANLADTGAVSVALGNDPPAVLLDALARYTAAKNATRAHDMEQERKERAKRRG